MTTASRQKHREPLPARRVEPPATYVVAGGLGLGCGADLRGQPPTMTSEMSGMFNSMAGWGQCRARPGAVFSRFSMDIIPLADRIMCAPLRVGRLLRRARDRGTRGRSNVPGLWRVVYSFRSRANCRSRRPGHRVAKPRTLDGLVRDEPARQPRDLGVRQAVEHAKPFLHGPIFDDLHCRSVSHSPTIGTGRRSRQSENSEFCC